MARASHHTPHIDQLYLNTLPKEPGVYLMKNQRGQVLYVGKAKILKNRVKQYFLPKRDDRIMLPFLTSQVTEIETIVTLSEEEALLLENTLIKRYRPKYNVLLKDDKTFISLMINHHHRWPMVKLVRCRSAHRKENLYFGPYTNALAARNTLDLMAHLFQLRQCSDRELASRKRPCLLYSIKRCLAPCVDKCTKAQYEGEVNRAISFLKGDDRNVIKQLKKEMQQASDQMEFERADNLKKTIEQIKHVTHSQHSTICSKGQDCDLFFLYKQKKFHVISQLIFRQEHLTGIDHFKFVELASSDQEIWETFLLQYYHRDTNRPPPPKILLPTELNRKESIEKILSTKILHPQRGKNHLLLQLAHKNAKAFMEQLLSQEGLLLDLQERCELGRCPIHIECFDTSNISATDFVACMVRFSHGKRDTKRTRRFIIKHVKKPDDYGALKEVLIRHYSKAKKSETLPDLTLIDGGKGQLNIALKVFRELEIASVDLIALAKEDGRHSKGLNCEKIFIPHRERPILLPPRSSALLILQKIRDETHRAAHAFHRTRRSRRLITTELKNIPGIGPQKSLLLLQHFGSTKQIKKAPMRELQKIKALTKNNLRAIEEFQKRT